MALAALNHESSKKFLPSGGWGHNIVGDPDAGFGHSQPGSWPFSVMMFMDAATNIQQAAGFRYGGSPVSKQTLLGQMCTGANAPQPMFYCPTRRTVANYPVTGGAMGGPVNVTGVTATSLCAKTDYAGNFGDNGFKNSPAGEPNDWSFANGGVSGNALVVPTGTSVPTPWREYAEDRQFNREL